MNQQEMLMMLPGLQPDELLYIQSITRDMSEKDQQQFFSLFKTKRKEKQELLILTIIGFFGIAGIQRFVIGETGMGLLHLFTFGLCGIGTIIDLINLDKMVSKYNQKQALETANMMKMLSY